MFNKILGKKIREARKAKGISQKELAKKLRVSDKAISSYEVGRTSPSIEILEKLSNTVEKPLSYFGTQETQEINIQEKLIRIEKELQEVKALLKQRRK